VLSDPEAAFNNTINGGVNQLGYAAAQMLLSQNPDYTAVGRMFGGDLFQVALTAVGPAGRLGVGAVGARPSAGAAGALDALEGGAGIAGSDITSALGPTISVNPALLAKTANGVKFSTSNVIATAQLADGEIVFLETGNDTSGLQHIVDDHGQDFANIGVAPTQIPGVIMEALTQGKFLGYQGTGTGRAIYQITINGAQQKIAITVSSNGYIVGANPAGSVR
jgi:filamentous hemagglutinin